ncbi:MAG: class I SAM-dependent methyltransferase [Anaerolineales bacterium]|nr:class I SAM-dependent methyltransferase [Anaerolineales bacterium]
MTSRVEQIARARRLIQAGIPAPGGTWADLGCGDGIFTSALYEIVGENAQIHAVDRERYALQRLERNLRAAYPPIQLITHAVDFTSGLELIQLDGILMANSLHFVRQKALALRGLADALKPGGRLIVVEYNTNRGNQWVPHPLDEDAFLELAQQAGYQEARILHKEPISYMGEFYAGMACKLQIAD